MRSRWTRVNSNRLAVLQQSFSKTYPTLIQMKKIQLSSLCRPFNWITSLHSLSTRSRAFSRWTRTSNLTMPSKLSTSSSKINSRRHSPCLMKSKGETQIITCAIQRRCILQRLAPETMSFRTKQKRMLLLHMITLSRTSATTTRICCHRLP